MKISMMDTKIQVCEVECIDNKELMMSFFYLEISIRTNKNYGLYHVC